MSSDCISPSSLPIHRYLGSVFFAFKNTLTTALNHKTCINTSGHLFKKKRPYSLSMLSLLVKIAIKANRVFLKPVQKYLLRVVVLVF